MSTVWWIFTVNVSANKFEVIHAHTQRMSNTQQQQQQQQSNKTNHVKHKQSQTIKRRKKKIKRILPKNYIHAFSVYYLFIGLVKLVNCPTFSFVGSCNRTEPKPWNVFWMDKMREVSMQLNVWLNLSIDNNNCFTFNSISFNCSFGEGNPFVLPHRMWTLSWSWSTFRAIVAHSEYDQVGFCFDLIQPGFFQQLQCEIEKYRRQPMQIVDEIVRRRFS